MVLTLIHALLLVWGAAGEGGLVVEGAWIREGPPGNRMMAGYMHLSNPGDRVVRVVSVQSDDFAAVSIHRTVNEGGLSRMEEVSELVLSPGESASFEPGGLHLMLMGPMRPLRAGDVTRIQLKLDGRHELSVEFEVRGLDR